MSTHYLQYHLNDNNKRQFLLLILLFLLILPSVHTARATPLSADIEMLTVSGHPNDDAKEFAVSAPASAWQPITLPFYQPRQMAAKQDDNRFVQYVFRYTPTISQTSDKKNYAFYLPRWQTIGWIYIYADDQLVYASQTGPVWNSYNHPIWVEFQSQANPKQIVVHIKASQQAGLALSPIYVDEAKKLYPSYLLRASLQTRLPETISSALCLCGLFAFSIWLRKRDEWVYLLFFAVSIFSHLRCLQYFVGEYPLVISEDWFSWMVVNASGWTIVFTYAVCTYLFAIKLKRLQWCLGTLMLVVSFVTLPSWPWSADFGQVWSIASLIIFIVLLVYIFMMVVLAWKSRSTEGMWLAGVFILNIPFGIHDLMLQNYLISIKSIYLLPYTSIGSLVVLLLIVRSRYLQAMQDIQLANQHLESKLAQREEELHNLYKIKQQEEKQSLILQERERLMKDMHDGFGSTLTTTMLLLKSGRIDIAQAGLYLEECIDDLKLVIDSIEPSENCVAVALAQYGFRIQQKLMQANVECQTDFDTLPTIEWVTPTHLLHLLRILQEVFVNILKHADAKFVMWSMKIVQNQLVITIKDDGVGFDIENVKKNRGLANIHLRSQRLHISTQWPNQEKGTCFCMTLPIEHNSELQLLQ